MARPSRKSHGRRGPNRVNSLQLSLFDAIIAIDGAMETIREQYPGASAPIAVVICYRKLAERREQLRKANAFIARLAAA